ncbi:helix-turn-helix domain-containing protein [Streptomyces sp. NPDC055037]
MQELYLKVAAIEPDAGAALKVIAYFDRLIGDHASLEVLVRGAAVLSGRPAQFVDDDRRVRIRVEPDGCRRDSTGPLDPAWRHTLLTPGQAGGIWLETDEADNPVHAMVLERAVTAAGIVLDRTRGRSSAAGPGDAALIEVVLDSSAPPHVRLQAAARLGLREGVMVRAVALFDGAARVEAVPAHGHQPAGFGATRAGIGPATTVLDLPASWAEAKTALRFTAEGSVQDPGPRTVHADELGVLALLAESVDRDARPVGDVRALDRAFAAAPWVASTLHAAVFQVSLRAAAVELSVHHSTLQTRLAQAERWLGWNVREPQGRLRVQLAIYLWRLYRNHAMS